MARHLARHLVAAGYPVLALDRDPGRLAAVPGAEAAGLDRIAACGVVITSLPDDASLRAVALERRASCPGWRRTACWSRPVPSRRRRARRCARPPRRGVSSISRPPGSGSTATAEAAALTLFCSGAGGGPGAGPPAALDLRPHHSRRRYGGGSALPQARDQPLRRLDRADRRRGADARPQGRVAWETVLAVLGSTVAASPLVAYKLDPLRRRDFTPAFSVARCSRT